MPTIERLTWLRAALAVVCLSCCFAVIAGEATARESKGAKVVHAAGSTVKALQKALGIPADGIYGPQTRRAVRRFQRSHGLVVDGLAGPQTLQALGVRASSTRRPRSASAVLARIAQCESGGNPAKASEAEQDRRALILYRRAGTSPWPSCGR